MLTKKEQKLLLWMYKDEQEFIKGMKNTIGRSFPIKKLWEKSGLYGKIKIYNAISNLERHGLISVEKYSRYITLRTWRRYEKSYKKDGIYPKSKIISFTPDGRWLGRLLENCERLKNSEI